jgi:small neutral amino acid transporter SnatA (MarC family)
MKKYLILLSPIAYLSLATSAFAQTPIGNPCGSGEFSALCMLQAKDLGGIVGSLLQFIFVIAVIVALFYLIYGGFRWLVSSGDKTQVAAAREHIVAAIIGLVIIFLSYFLLSLLLGFFGIDLSHLTIPKIPGAGS